MCMEVYYTHSITLTCFDYSYDHHREVNYKGQIHRNTIEVFESCADIGY